MNDCMTLCATLPLGTSDADAGGNTVGCRQYHTGVANMSQSNADAHCPHASFSGGGTCGTPCESYCNVSKAACYGTSDATLKFFADDNFCTKACPLMNQSGTPIDKTGNGIYCHIYHATAALTVSNVTHCPHASPSGAPNCGTKCENYCAIVMNACTGNNSAYADMATCLAFCSSLPSGNITDTTGNSIDCRIYHAEASKVLALPDVHCPHATHSGGNQCGTWCEVYCQLATTVCTGNLSLFTDKATCMTACGGLALTGKAGDTTGNSVQCRIYHIGAAMALNLKDVHCPHGNITSTQCTTGPTTTLPPTTTTSSTPASTTKSNNAFAIVVSSLMLFAVLLF